MHSNSIPIIDIKGIQSAKGLEEIGLQLKEVYSDIGLGTLINHGVDQIGGLQVRTKGHQSWVDVKPVLGTLVLNTAEVLMR